MWQVRETHTRAQAVRTWRDLACVADDPLTQLQPDGEPSFIIPLVVACLAYLLAIRELFSTPQFPNQVISFGLAFAALWHFQLLRMPPGLDDDVHRYVWDGRAQRLGYNPYILVPNDPAVAGLHTPETLTLNNPEVPTPTHRSAAILSLRNRDSRIYIRAEGSIL